MSVRAAEIHSKRSRLGSTISAVSYIRALRMHAASTVFPLPGGPVNVTRLAGSSNGRATHARALSIARSSDTPALLQPSLGE